MKQAIGSLQGIMEVCVNESRLRRRALKEECIGYEREAECRRNRQDLLVMKSPVSFFSFSFWVCFLICHPDRPDECRSGDRKKKERKKKKKSLMQREKKLTQQLARSVQLLHDNKVFPSSLQVKKKESWNHESPPLSIYVSWPSSTIPVTLAQSIKQIFTVCENQTMQVKACDEQVFLFLREDNFSFFLFLYVLTLNCFVSLISHHHAHEPMIRTDLRMKKSKISHDGYFSNHRLSHHHHPIYLSKPPGLFNTSATASSSSSSARSTFLSLSLSLSPSLSSHMTPYIYLSLPITHRTLLQSNLPLSFSFPLSLSPRDNVLARSYIVTISLKGSDIVWVPRRVDMRFSFQYAKEITMEGDKYILLTDASLSPTEMCLGQYGDLDGPGSISLQLRCSPDSEVVLMFHLWPICRKTLNETSTWARGEPRNTGIRFPATSVSESNPYDQGPTRPDVGCYPAIKRVSDGGRKGFFFLEGYHRLCSRYQGASLPRARPVTGCARLRLSQPESPPDLCWALCRLGSRGGRVMWMKRIKLISLKMKLREPGVRTPTREGIDISP
ncbi:hypothetical protein VP01_2500g2 [Puccinia sorghi]|uniref:Uncharacterized protein n=1 Tax=Puccinia sorghi TaxID=27349 RepID=A0A0L6V5J6_9BASI|nr:hypothetical protein VP01_2500g2 [Puccinia sorghi]